MNALAGRGDKGITREILIERAAMLGLGGAGDVEAGKMAGKITGTTAVQMRLVALGDERVLVQVPAHSQAQKAEAAGNSEVVWRNFRAMIDALDGPMDEARSMAMFGKVMRRLRAQQDTELRWRWVRRVATALAAAAGAGAVRMLSR